MSTEQWVANEILEGAERMRVDLRSALDLSDEAFDALQQLAGKWPRDGWHRVNADQADSDDWCFDVQGLRYTLEIGPDEHRLYSIVQVERDDAMNVIAENTLVDGINGRLEAMSRAESYAETLKEDDPHDNAVG